MAASAPRLPCAWLHTVSQAPNVWLLPLLPQVQSDLAKDGGHLYFVKHLECREPGVPPESRAQVRLGWAVCYHRAACSQWHVLQTLARRPARSYRVQREPSDDT